MTGTNTQRVEAIEVEAESGVRQWEDDEEMPQDDLPFAAVPSLRILSYRSVYFHHIRSSLHTLRVNSIKINKYGMFFV